MLPSSVFLYPLNKERITWLRTQMASSLLLNFSQVYFSIYEPRSSLLLCLLTTYFTYAYFPSRLQIWTLGFFILSARLRNTSLCCDDFTGPQRSLDHRRKENERKKYPTKIFLPPSGLICKRNDKCLTTLSMTELDSSDGIFSFFLFFKICVIALQSHFMS